MKKEEFLDALEYIDEDLLEEAEQIRAHKRHRSHSWMRIACAAAVLMLVIPGAVITWNMTHSVEKMSQNVTGSMEYDDEILEETYDTGEVEYEGAFVESSEEIVEDTVEDTVEETAEESSEDASQESAELEMRNEKGGTIAEFSDSEISISVALPENWNYEIIAPSGECKGGLRIFKATDSSQGMEIAAYELWGVCGTGLEESTITLENGLTGSMGTYDQHPYWDYICFENEPKIVAMTMQMDETWWDENGDILMQILNSLQFETR